MKIEPECAVAAARPPLRRKHRTGGRETPFPAPPRAGRGMDPLLWPASTEIYQTRPDERAVAWQMQAKVFGGLKPETHKLLMRIAEADAAKRKGEAPAPPKFRPGMRLIREWNGKVHTVDVLDKGFAWNGKLYSSLSPIARAITGAHWSGPRFFTP